MSETDSFDFSDLALIEIPVVGPDKIKYVLREATGEAARQYNNARISGALFGPSGKVQKVEGAGDLEVLLVSLCLFGEQNRPVHQSTIARWPERVVKKLFDKIKEISFLDETDNPVKKSLDLALQRADSPVTLTAFKEFALKLEGAPYASLRALFAEEQLGN